MFRRWVPACMLVAGVMSVSPAIWAETTSGKPAPAPAKPAASGTATAPTPPPTDPKAAAPAPKPADGKPPSPEDVKEAERLYSEGRKAEKTGHLDKARDLLSASWKLDPKPQRALLLARVEAKINRWRDATEHVDIFLRLAKDASADEKKEAQKLFDDVAARIGTWIINVNMAGAEVFLDGKSVGLSPLAAPLYVDVGPHEIAVKANGYSVEKELLAVAPGTESETNVVMKPLPKTAAKPPKPKKPEEKKPPPPPPSPKWRTYGIIGGGALTALGLGLGIGLAVSASGKSDEADAQLAEIQRTTPNTYGLCGPNLFPPNVAACAQVKETLSSQDARANGAIAGFVIAGIGAVGTVGLILLPKLPFGRKLMGVQVTPVLSAERMGGTISGTF